MSRVFDLSISMRESLVGYYYRVGCLLGLLLASGSASALQMIRGNVREIEVTYMPARIQFTLSEGNTACPKGKTLVWANSSQDNNKVVYATLVSALVGGKKVNFYVDDNDQTCTGKFIYIAE